MILEEALAGLLYGIVFLIGGFLSAVALSNLNREAPEPGTLKQANGLFLLGAALLFFGVGWVGHRILIEPGEEAALPLLLGLTAAGGAAACVWLWITCGPVPRSSDSPGFAWTAKAYLVFLPLYFAAHLFNNWFAGLFIDAPTLPEQDVVAGMREEVGVPLAIAVAGVVLVQPLLEEILFRGYLWRFLAVREDFGPRRALVFTTIVFMVMHGSPQFWLPLAVLGAFFGWVYWRTGSVVQALFAHALHNGSAVLLVMI